MVINKAIMKADTKARIIATLEEFDRVKAELPIETNIGIFMEMEICGIPFEDGKIFLSWFTIMAIYKHNRTNFKGQYSL